MAYDSTRFTAFQTPTLSEWNQIHDNTDDIKTSVEQAWQTWSPTFDNMTVGNGAFDYARYRQVGKTVEFSLSFTFGSTTDVTGNLSVSLPVAENATISTVGAVLGESKYVDSGTSSYSGVVDNIAAGKVRLLVRGVAGTYANLAQVTASAPVSGWGTPSNVGDQILINGSYEAA